MTLLLGVDIKLYFNEKEHALVEWINLAVDTRLFLAVLNVITNFQAREKCNILWKVW